MISITVLVAQGQGEGRAQAAQAPAHPVAPDPAQLRQQIEQSIEAARQAAEGSQERVTVGPNGIIVRPNRPGQPTVYVDPGAVRNMIPPQVVDIAVAFCITLAVIIVGWPIARAFGRRIERRGQVATLDQGTMEQLQRIEQAVDAMAIEVERISESQRFMARLQRDGAAQVLPSLESR